MDLGQALVQELRPDRDIDTLSRWMAHYIAELIEDVKSASDADRQVKFAKCADAILKLWEHRHLLPDGKRPFEDWEPILKTLERLDPDDDTPRYFRTSRIAVSETEENTETMKWLELADGLDYSAKILIRYCLTQAAQVAIDNSKEWVALAKGVGQENDGEFSVLRIIINESSLLKEGEPDDSARKILEERIGRLEAFSKMADAFASDLCRQLQENNEQK